MPPMLRRCLCMILTGREMENKIVDIQDDRLNCSEEELVLFAQNGDGEAEEFLIRKYNQKFNT